MNKYGLLFRCLVFINCVLFVALIIHWIKAALGMTEVWVDPGMIDYSIPDWKPPPTWWCWMVRQR